MGVQGKKPLMAAAVQYLNNDLNPGGAQLTNPKRIGIVHIRNAATSQKWISQTRFVLKAV